HSFWRRALAVIKLPANGPREIDNDKGVGNGSYGRTKQRVGSTTNVVRARRRARTADAQTARPRAFEVTVVHHGRRRSARRNRGPTAAAWPVFSPGRRPTPAQDARQAVDARFLQPEASSTRCLASTP